MLRVTAFLRPARLLFCSTIIVRDMTCWDGAWPVSVCSPTSHDLKPTAARIGSHDLFTKYHASSKSALQAFLVGGLKWL